MSMQWEALKRAASFTDRPMARAGATGHATAVGWRRASFVAMALVLLVSSASRAETVSFGGLLPTTGQTWTPPDPDSGGLLSAGDVPYVPFSIFVPESGTFTVTVGAEDDDALFSGLFALYGGEFDPLRPRRNLIGAQRFGETLAQQASIDVLLQGGVIYTLVTSYSAAAPFPIGPYTGTITGPARVRRSGCFPVGDEVDSADDERAGQSLQEERFCVMAEWATRQGTSGFARPVAFRSEDSLNYWFFDSANWELQVKLLDGCAVNGHYWVFLAAATDVEFEVEVFGRGPNLNVAGLQRVYANPQGNRARAVTDITAFPCSSVTDVL